MHKAECAVRQRLPLPDLVQVHEHVVKIIRKYKRGLLDPDTNVIRGIGFDGLPDGFQRSPAN